MFTVVCFCVTLCFNVHCTPMDNSIVIISNDNSVDFKGYNYIYTTTKRNKQHVYECPNTLCKSRIILDETKTKFSSGYLIHNHSDESLEPNKKTENKNKTNKIPKTSNQIQKSGSKSECNSETKKPSVNLKANEPIDNTNLPQTRDATLKSQNELTPDKNDNKSKSTTPCSESNASLELKFKSAENKISELIKLHDSLIDQIMQKEKIIINKDLEIETLKNQLESAQTKHDNSSLNKNTKRPHNEGKKQKVKFYKNGVNSEPMNVTSVTASNHHNKLNEFVDKCHLIGDSHCRGLVYYLKRYIEKVESFFKPGSGFIGIRDSSTSNMNNLSQNERVIYFCGTNDIESRNWSLVFESIQHILTKHKNHQCCFILVPLRWDRPHLNNVIHKFNKKLKALLHKHDIPYLDPSYFLRPWHYARDGLHMNINGKRLLSIKLKNYLKNSATHFGQRVDNTSQVVRGPSLNSQTNHQVLEPTTSSYSNRVNPIPRCNVSFTSDDSAHDALESGNNTILGDSILSLSNDNENWLCSPATLNTKTTSPSCLPEKSHPIETIVPNAYRDSTCNSFTLDQSYAYDMAHLNLISSSNVNTPNLCDTGLYSALPMPETTPNYPTIDVSEISIPSESTFTISPRSTKGT